MLRGSCLLQAKNGDKAALGEFAHVVDMVERCNGFAEVFPEHKFEIVAILQVGACRFAGQQYCVNKSLALVGGLAVNVCKPA